MKAILIKGDDKEFKELVVGGLMLKFSQDHTPDQIQVMDVYFSDFVYKRDVESTVKVLLINYHYPEGEKRHGSVPHVFGDVVISKTLDVGTEYK